MIINHRTCRKPLDIKDSIVEIGFGRGDTLVELSKKYPDRTVIGFELSGISIEKAFARIKKENLKNVFIVNMDAFWGFHFLIPDESITRIYMNFPDPWFKKRHRKRRLTSKRNLLMYAKKLKKGGKIRILTDYYPLAEDTIALAAETGVYQEEFRVIEKPFPVTKYALKAIEEGREIYEIILTRTLKPAFEEPKVEEVGRLFPVKIEGHPKVEQIRSRTIEIGPGVILKTGEIVGNEKRMLLECLLSEEGFVQKFFIEVKKKGDDEFIVDVSPFSEVIRTRNLSRAVKIVAEMISKP